MNDRSIDHLSPGFVFHIFGWDMIMQKNLGTLVLKAVPSGDVEEKVKDILYKAFEWQKKLWPPLEATTQS